MPLINTPKIVSAIIISLTMTACNSGGNHATQNVTTSPQQSDADKKAAEDKATADKKAAEDKAIADKKAAEDKAIADKKAAEDKVTADKKAAEDKAIADKAAADKAIADKKAAEDKAIADKKSAEDKAATDKKAAEDKAIADKKAAEDKAIADKKAAEDKVTADKKAAEDKVTADKKAAEDKAIADKKAAEDKVTADKKAAEDKAIADKAAADKKADEDKTTADDKASGDIDAAIQAALDATDATEKAVLKLVAQTEFNKAKATNNADNVDIANDNLVKANIAYKTAVIKSRYSSALYEITTRNKDTEQSAYNFANQKAEAYKNALSKSQAHQSDINEAITTFQNEDTAIKKAESTNAKTDQDNANKASKIADAAERKAISSAFELATYEQNYSVVLGSYSTDHINYDKNGEISGMPMKSDISVIGIKTNSLPTQGKATYTGHAFTSTLEFNPLDLSTKNQGMLDYTVNFTERTGSGSITGLGDAITLEKGSISATDISSTVKQADKKGTYSLGFYGKNAEEIAGKVVFDGKDTVGFGGTRGDVK